MKKKNQSKVQTPRAKKDTLVLIGNGFDRWQNLPTGYDSFQAYYIKKRDKIMRKLRLRPIKVEYEDDGHIETVSDVELIYGDPYEPTELEADFWYAFESQLAHIDSTRLNYFFGKSRRDLKALAKCIKNADKILREAFSGWVRSIEVSPAPPKYDFGDNCVFVTFNYTDTLEKRFGIDPKDVFHIHGTANDKKSIIYGHAAHPHSPDPTLRQIGGRFRGLYYVEKVLEATDKKIYENLVLLSLFLSMHGINATDIRHVCVLGHSFGEVDEEYFRFLVNNTVVAPPVPPPPYQFSDEELDPLNLLHLNIQYAVHRYGEGIPEKQIDPAERAAVQMIREYDKNFFDVFAMHELYGKDGVKAFMSEIDAPAPRVARTHDADWHISYYSPDDETRIRNCMQTLGCTNITLHHGIDDCIKPFIKH